MHLKHITVLTAALCGICAAASVGDVSLVVQTQRNEIYAPESVAVFVTVKGEDDPANPPDLTGIRDFEVAFRGSSSRSQQSISIVNGRMTQTRTRERVFRYELTPRRTGELRAGPVRLKTDRDIRADPGPVIKVLGIEDQDFVLIRVSPSKSEVLVDESFSVTVSILVKCLEGQYRTVEPMDPGAPPALTIPYLSEEATQGLERPDLDSLFGKLEATSPNVSGFSINNRSSTGASLFAMIDGPRRARFALPKRTVTRHGKDYFEYTLSASFTPVHEGTHTFGPVVFRGTIIGGVTKQRRAVGKNIYAIGPAATVHVIPPPEEGRPETYIGVVGTNVSAEASLDALTCQVGDPLTLTLVLRGGFRKANVRTPVLGSRPEFARDFRVYDDSSQVHRSDDEIRFVYTVRPTTAGTLEFPPIRLSYYDTGERVYRTVSTHPIPVRANPGAQVGGEIIIGAATNAVTLSAGADTEALFTHAPLNVDPTGALPAPIAVEFHHVAIAAVGPLLLALLLSVRFVRKHSATISASFKRRTVIHEVRQTLKEAEALASGAPPKAGRLVYRALQKYLAWHFGALESALTPADVDRLLREHGVGETVRRPLSSILRSTFNASYAGEADSKRNIEQDCRAAQDLVDVLSGTRKETGEPS